MKASTHYPVDEDSGLLAPSHWSNRAAARRHLRSHACTNSAEQIAEAIGFLTLRSALTHLLHRRDVAGANRAIEQYASSAGISKRTLKRQLAPSGICITTGKELGADLRATLREQPELRTTRGALNDFPGVRAVLVMVEGRRA